MYGAPYFNHYLFLQESRFTEVRHCVGLTLPVFIRTVVENRALRWMAQVSSIFPIFCRSWLSPWLILLGALGHIYTSTSKIYHFLQGKSSFPSIDPRIFPFHPVEATLTLANNGCNSITPGCRLARHSRVFQRSRSMQYRRRCSLWPHKARN